MSTKPQKKKKKKKKQIQKQNIVTCIKEKLYIIINENKNNFLNKRNELISKYRHKNKLQIKNIYILLWILRALNLAKCIKRFRVKV